jgi:putative sugar O-methyltransferase
MLERYSFHGLQQNDDLSEIEYAGIKSAVGQVNDLLNDWSSYVDRNGLDPRLFHTQNEWAGIISVSQSRELRYRDDFQWVNYIRLLSPFTGFYLPFLDRIGGAQLFGNEVTERIQAEIAHGIPENIVELMDTLDPHERLAHVIDEQHRLTANIPSKFVVKMPLRGGEVGLMIDGAIVNPDTIYTQGRINSMYNFGILRAIEENIEKCGKCRVLEIGGGYGALARALHSLFPGKLEYVMMDLPESLWSAAGYMTVTGPTDVLEPGQAFPDTFETLMIANYLAEECRTSLGPVDLAINTMSFIEMSEAQVRYYRDLIGEVLAEDGRCFIEGIPSKPEHVDCNALFAETMPARFRLRSRPAYTGEAGSTMWREKKKTMPEWEIVRQLRDLRRWVTRTTPRNGP